MSGLFKMVIADPVNLAKTLTENKNLLFITRKINNHEEITLLSHICTYSTEQKELVAVINNIGINTLTEDNKYFKLNSTFMQYFKNKLESHPYEKISSTFHCAINKFKFSKEDTKSIVNLLSLRVEKIKLDKDHRIKQEMKQNALNNTKQITSSLASKLVNELKNKHSIIHVKEEMVSCFKGLFKTMGLDVEKSINATIENSFVWLRGSEKLMLPYLTGEDENKYEELVSLHKDITEEFNRYSDYIRYKFSKYSYDIIESVSSCHLIMASIMSSKGEYRKALDCFRYGTKLIADIQDIAHDNEIILTNSKRFTEELKGHYLSLKKAIEDSDDNNKSKDNQEYKETLNQVDLAIQDHSTVTVLSNLKEILSLIKQ